MCCFFLLFAAFGPRFAIIAMWLFGNRVDLAFGSWLWPLLGLLIAPWTTLMYLLVWSPSAVSPAASGSSSVSGLRSTWRPTAPSPPKVGTRPELSVLTGPTSHSRPRPAHGYSAVSVAWRLRLSFDDVPDDFDTADDEGEQDERARPAAREEWSDEPEDEH